MKSPNGSLEMPIVSPSLLRIDLATQVFEPTVASKAIRVGFVKIPLGFDPTVLFAHHPQAPRKIPSVLFKTSTPC